MDQKGYGKNTERLRCQTLARLSTTG
ncbi:hypothetical protein CBM2629_A10101 [Cupriavidus taiwanensis]|nr:hypothetical protein CBM2629_A10101 [Cupriavidus taiwanensis]